MVSLRSFTVINGKPALYGDGLINVVRMSGKVTYLRTGCDEVNGKLIGFCEAKRSDTGEDIRKKHIGITRPKQTIKSAPFAKSEKPDRGAPNKGMPPLPRPQLYREESP